MVVVDPDPNAAEEKEQKKTDAYEEVAEKLDALVDGEGVPDEGVFGCGCEEEVGLVFNLLT
jgi:hypothetical protein